MCPSKYTFAGYKTFLTKAERKVYNEQFAMLSGEAGLTTDGEVRCPSCGTSSPPGRRNCASCGATLSSSAEVAASERALPEDMPRPRMANRSERASVPVEYERVERTGEKKLLEPDDEIRVDRADMVEKETYQCLICGSPVPALADKCPTCGTIFLSETEVHHFTGIPVARVPRRGELEAAQEVPRAEEVVDLEQTLPRPLSASALKESDVLPVPEPAGREKAAIKKRVLKKLVKRTG